MEFIKGTEYKEEFIVSEEVYKGFISVFKDMNPLHTNGDFAKDKGFQGVVMHGNILNGFVSFFIGEKLPTKDVIIHKQEIKYKSPVYLNDKLSFVAKVNEVFDSVQAVEFKFSFSNEKGIKVAVGKVQIGVI